MVDLNSLISVASTYADLIGVALIAAGVFLGLIRRALGFLIVGVGIVATLFVATIEQQQGQTELFVWLILGGGVVATNRRSEEHTSELQSRSDLVCRLLLEKKKQHDAICLTEP